MNLSAQFKEYLLSQSNPPSRITVKNYLSDINKFIRWIEAKLGYEFNPSDINQSLIDSFKEESLKSYSASSVDRSLSSLRKFFYFLKLEGKISQTPFEVSTVKSEAPDPWKLKEFKNHLYVFGASHLTIKNYIIDVKQFLTWADEVVKTDETWEISKTNNFSKITSGLIEEYKNRLLNEAHLSPVSVNRKLSSIRRFITWANEEGLIKDNAEVVNLPSNTSGFKANTSDALAAAVAIGTISSDETPASNEYSAFPPLRVYQKTKDAGIAAFDTAITNPLADVLDKSDEVIWNLKGRPVFRDRLKASLKIPSFKMVDPKKINNVPKSFYAPALMSTANFPLHRKFIHHARHSRPKWYKTYHSYAFASYLHFSILMLFISAMGYMVFNDFNTKQQAPILAALPSAPPRILSFQGRLTDANDNPITKGTTLRMAIYNNQTASGSALLWQETVSPTPDEEGIFSILLGNNNPIPQSLFAQNSGLWLGIAVENTQELKPRQQIATVAFAANAETLQGLPPITNTSATSNVVLALNSSGNLTIGGTANPTFQATGGTFTVSGRTLVLTTSSNGNIRLAPNGTGIIDIQKSVQNTSNSGLVVPGSVTIEDLFSIIATSSGHAVINLSQGSTGDLIIASTSGSTKFRIDNGGNLTAAGSINGLGVSSGTITSGTWQGTAIGAPYGGTGQTSYSTGDLLFASDSTVLSKLGIGANGDCLISNGTTPSWSNCGGDTSVGTSNWTVGAGYITPNNSTLDLLIGSHSTESAKFAILNVAGSGPVTATISGNLIVMPTNGDGGNIGIGITNPAARLHTISSGGNNVSEIHDYYSDTLNGPGIVFRKARGTLENPTASLLGDNLGNIGGRGYGTTGFSTFTKANIAFIAEENWTDTEQGAYISFLTTATGGTTRSEKLRITGSGNVGIGTTSPTAKLDVAGEASVGGQLTFRSGIAQIQSTQNQTLTLGGDTTGNISFKPGNSTNSLFLKSDGNVGIGTTNPLSQLTVGEIGNGPFDLLPTGGYSVAVRSEGDSNNGIILVASDFESYGGALRINVPSAFGSVGYRAQIQANSYSGNMDLGLQPSGGNVAIGLGSNDATAKLDVGGTASVGGQLSFRSGTAQIQSTANQTLTIGGNTTGNIILSPLNGNGYVGIGNSSPIAPLHVYNSANNNNDKVILGKNQTGTGASAISTSNIQLALLGEYNSGYNAASNAVKLYIGDYENDGATVYPIYLEDENNGVDFWIKNRTSQNSSPTLYFAGNTGIGITSPSSQLQVTRPLAFGVTGKALAIFDQIENQDILTASKSGVPMFTVSSSGDITFAGGDITNGSANIDIGEAASGDITVTGDFIPSADNSYTLGSSSSSWNTLYIKGPFNLNGSNGVSGQCLLSGGAGAATWGNCQTLANNYWQLNSNLLSPVNSTYDFAIGGTASNAAKFAVLNVAGGTPTASISANSGAGATYLNGSGQLGTTSRQALILGNSTGNNTTGDVFISPDLSSGLRVGIGTTDTRSTNSLAVGGASGDLIRLIPGTSGGLISESAFVTFNARGRFGYDGSISGGAVVLSDANASKPIIFMAGGPSVEKLRIGANLTSASASVSGSTSFAGLVVDNSFASGDIFTASKSGKTHFVIDRNGNVGVGTSTPTDLIEAVRNQNAASIISLRNTDGGANAYAASEFGNGTGYAQFGIAGTGYTDATGLFTNRAYMYADSSSDGILLYTTGSTDPIVFATDDIERGRFSATGQFGLGTAAPTAHLDVAGTASVGGQLSFRSGTAQIQSTANQTLTIGGDTTGYISLLPINGTGKVGIGTSTPKNLLHIYQASNPILRIGDASAAEGWNDTALGEIIFGTHYDLQEKTKIYTWGNFATTGYTPDLRFKTNSFDRMTILGTGAVGIGTTAPLMLLQVETNQSATSTAMFYNSNTGSNADGIIVKLGASSLTSSGCGNSGNCNEFISFLNGDGLKVGKIHASGTNTIAYKTNGTDFAELFVNTDSEKNLPEGTLMCSSGKEKVERCGKNNNSILGVISERAGFIGGKEHPDAVTVGLIGQIPVLVSTESGQIKKGDFITTSSQSGIGSKAINPGFVVGRAMEDNNGSGKVWALINTSWYDPDVQLADSGLLTLAPTVDDNFEVKRQTGETVNRIGAFSEILVAKLKAGYLETGKLIVTGSASVKNLTTETLASTIGNFSQLSTDSLVIGSENINIAGQSLREYIASIVENVVGESGNEDTIIVSPILATDIITPKTGKTLSVKLNSDDESSSFNIMNLSGSTVASIDALGNASLSGELRSESIQTGDASVSGTLRADRIIANQIEGLNIQASSVSANYITNNYYQATPSANYNQATGSASFDNLMAMRATFEQGLMAFGPASFYEASVADRLFVGSKLSLADTSINVLGGNLELQPLRQGGVSLVGGLVEIDVDGNLKVNGNAYFAKDVDIKGKLLASFVSPLPGRDFVLELGRRDENGESENHDSSFVIRNSSASALLSVNNQGDLNASGAGTFNKLNLNIVNKALALSPTEVIATGSAGTAEIQPNREELTIRNNLVTEDSLIYITTKTSTQSESVYLLRQVPGKSFTVGISNPINKKVPFNWIIIN